MNLYNLKSTGLGYRITKFDFDLNPESSYEMTRDTCQCPQGHKATCRHRRMFPIFETAKRIDTPWFLCFEDSTWHDPTGQAEGAPNVGEGSVPSTSAATLRPSSSQTPPPVPDLRGEPAPLRRRV